MFAPFEKEYGTPLTEYPEWRLRQAAVLYPTSAKVYAELGVKAYREGRDGMQNIRSAIQIAREVATIRQLLKAQ